jgi:hypothetical protein
MPPADTKGAAHERSVATILPRPAGTCSTADILAPLPA